MMLSFANPLALWAFLALPALWWLLRLTPPQPERVTFPPFRLLLGLVSTESQKAKTPWWLVALRVLIVSLVILAAARPIWGGENGSSVSTLSKGPVVIIVDDGWAAAAGWEKRQSRLAQLIADAGKAGRRVLLAGTTPTLTPVDLTARPERLTPRALATDRAALLRKLGGIEKGADIHWLSDGLGGKSGEDFARGLAALGALTVHTGLDLPAAITAAGLDGEAIAVKVHKVDPKSDVNVNINLRAENGRSLASTAVSFAAGERERDVKLALPLALRNEARRIELTGIESAAAVWLLDDRARRKAVGLVSGGRGEAGAEPLLLAPPFYLSRALEPFADIRSAGESGQSGIPDLIKDGLSLMALGDVGTLQPAAYEAVAKWVESGGVLVRFAGPRLAAGHDDLVPVSLRAGGGRDLGGAMSWESPQPIAPFADDSPFAGLSAPKDITVSKQVLAEPTPELAQHVWASLRDGTPLVTAAKRGKGLVVLFHSSATPDWSNLAVSGLFVDMLRRLVDLAPAMGGTDAAATTALAAAYAPESALDGFGAMMAMPPEAAPIPAAEIETARPSPLHPAGLYSRGGVARALNIAPTAAELTPLPLPAGTARVSYAPTPGRALAGAALLAALIAFAADGLAVLMLAGALPLRRAAAIAMIVIAGGGAHDARAQEQDAAMARAMEATRDTRLAYVITGSPDVDETSTAGLSGLSNFLRAHTAVEPGEPLGVDLETDELSFYPLIYWPVVADAPEPSPAALAKLDRFMKNGGTLFLDTREAGSVPEGMTGPAGEAMRRILARLDIPPLAPVPQGHVLTKSFYLLQRFPGRYDSGQLWVETTDSGNDADGVSGVIIGSNDYAAAWASDSTGLALYPAVPGGEDQREMAYRTGVNVVMYTLTGNYKADQVHVPALLERLGQ